MTGAEWVAACRLLAALWPDAKVPPETVKAWYPLVSGLDAGDVVEALYELRLRPDQRPPTPSDLWVASSGLATWQEALGTLNRRLASGESPRGSGNPALDEAVESFGGTFTLRNTDTTSGTFVAQFRDVYRAAAVRHLRERQADALARAVTSARATLALPTTDS